MISRFLLRIFALPKFLRMKISPWFNRWYFHAKRVDYGSRLCVMGSVSISGNGHIHIGDDFTMTNGDAINPISSNLQGAFLTEHGASISIGNNVGMSSTRLWIQSGLTIGDNVKIGAATLIIDTDTHPLSAEVRRFSNNGTQTSPITIGNDAWIGAHCIILKGVNIGARTVIGAGSVVTKSIPEDCIAAGNPCKIIRRNQHPITS